MIHRHDSGRIALSATLRYTIALLFPFWDGDAPGRAYTEKERRLSLERELQQLKGEM